MLGVPVSEFFPSDGEAPDSGDIDFNNWSADVFEVARLFASIRSAQLT